MIIKTKEEFFIILKEEKNYLNYNYSGQSKNYHSYYNSGQRKIYCHQHNSGKDFFSHNYQISEQSKSYHHKSGKSGEKKIEIIMKIVLILDKSKLVIILDKANQNYCNYCSYCSAARPLQVHYLISFKSKFIILASCFECQCSSSFHETHTQKAKK